MFGKPELEPRPGEKVRFCPEKHCDFHLWLDPNVPRSHRDETWAHVIEHHLATKHKE